MYKLMNLSKITAIHPPVMGSRGGSPWESLFDVFKGETTNLMTQLVVPAAAIILMVLGFIMLASAAAAKKNQQSDFQSKLIWGLVCVGVAAALGVIWGVLSASVGM